MLIKYRNEIYRRKERLGLSFCDQCPLKEFGADPCYIGNIPYICPLTEYIAESTSEIFNL